MNVWGSSKKILVAGLVALAMSFTGCLTDDGDGGSTPVGTKLTNEKTNDTVWNITGPNRGAFDLLLGATVGAAGAENTKDLKDLSNAAVLDAPAHPTEVKFPKMWGSGSGTTFSAASGFDYANATDSSAIKAYNAGAKATTTPVLATGNIIIAKVRGGTQYAVIKITGVVEVFGVAPVTSDNKDYILFDYKLSP